jgi:hypothetical protein
LGSGFFGALRWGHLQIARKKGFTAFTHRPHSTQQHKQQSDNAGVLVLSEFAGAAQSLGAGALLVNPWNIADVAQVCAGLALFVLLCRCIV